MVLDERGLVVKKIDVARGPRHEELHHPLRPRGTHGCPPFCRRFCVKRLTLQERSQRQQTEPLPTGRQQIPAAQSSW